MGNESLFELIQKAYWAQAQTFGKRFGVEPSQIHFTTYVSPARPNEVLFIASRQGQVIPAPFDVYSLYRDRSVAIGYIVGLMRQAEIQFAAYEASNLWC